jgi:lysophospholipase L1-like esterase
MRRAWTVAIGITAVLIGGVSAVVAVRQVRDERPTAIVALGDSAISGAGAGDYEPGTRGENGNWCQRSRNALVEHTSVADKTVNLACSGAKAANVSLADTIHNTEGSQAQRLIDVAREYRVTTVAVQVGADDDPAFARSVIDCVIEWLNPFGPGCREDLRTEWPRRLSAMAPKVAAAIGDVREAMSRADYADDDYDLILMSYASPLTEEMDTTVECPIEPADAHFARTTAVPQLSAALHGVAVDAGVRFLDLSRATEGHEACSADDAATEWQTRLMFSPDSLIDGGLDSFGLHLLQESFHPNARGHRQLGRCLTEFVRTDRPSAACIIGPDGNLHAEG